MKRLFFIFAALLILSAGLVTAQEQTGVLVGTVTDTDGAFLPGVTIEARSPAQPGVATAITDEVGRFRLIGLTPGTYQVTFRLPGFQTLIREGILVRLGRTFNLEVTIAQATMEEEVTVIGESPVVDIKKSGTTTNYGKEMIAKLPKGRDFTSVVNMTAGVNDENVGGGTMMDGASSSENMYFVDGMDTTSMYTGLSSQRVLMEFVEEVQVKSSGYEAEHGGSMGGVINVITRSGGNEFHGEITGYMRGSAFQANPDVKNLRINPIDDVTAEYIDYPEDSWTQYEVGLGLGGYIFKDRLWFFASFMPRFTSTDRTVELIADGNSYTTNQKQTSYFGQAKLTALFGGIRISASYINDYYKWKGALMDQDGTGATPEEYDYPIYGFNYPGETWGGRIDWIVSDNLFVGLNGGYFKIDTKQLVGPTGPRHFFLRSNIGIGAPEEHASGWYNYSYTDGYQTRKDIQKRYGANFDATLFVDLAGEHVWKAGFQYVRIAQDVDDAYPYVYNRWYWGLDYISPVNAVTYPTQYGYLHARQPFGSIADIHSDRYAIFLQDSWTINNKITLNFGIRAERENIPSFSDLPEYQEAPIKFGFGDKIAPRVGFAWDLFGDNSTKVFGSYGLYYDVMKLSMANGSYGGFKWISHYYDIRTLDWRYGQTTHPDLNLAPDFVYIESLNWRIPSFDTTQPDMEPYSKNEISLGLQRKLGEDVSLTVRYLYSNIRWAIEDIGIQTPEGEKYFNGNPGSDWINELYAANAWPECPKAKRRYHSVNVGIDKRFSNNWMAGFHYTYSNLWGNFSGLASSDEFGRHSPNVERYFDGWFLHRDQNLNESTGQLPTDRPHQFKLYGSYTWDFGLTLGFYSYLMSGTPVSTMLSLNSMQGYYPVGRFDQGRTSMLSRTDLYAEYNLSLGGRYAIQLNANISNLFGQEIAMRKYPYYNRQGIHLSDEELLAGYEYKTEVANAGVQLDPRYLKPYTYTDGIDVRFGVKFIF
ncbi:MAG: TonB-dependent receptor [Candidatus Aminicenantes bacterium]|jgi:hypothetical protein